LELNRFYIGDNKQILEGIDKDSVQLIYMDPPFFTGRDFYDFNDKFDSIEYFSYEFIEPRIRLCHSILKKDGVIVFHTDPKISHYMRMVLDRVFGFGNFLNEIIWYSGGNKKTKKKLGRYHDSLLVYSKGKNWKYNPIYESYENNPEYMKTTKLCPIRNKLYVTTSLINNQPNVVQRKNLRYEWNGHFRQWHISKEKMISLDADNRLQYNDKGIPRIKRYLDEMEGIPLKDIWMDINSIQMGEKVDYATQKPVKLLERIIRLFSDEEDIVMDIFAGTGTTGRAALALNRKYILMDTNEEGKKFFDKILEKRIANEN